MNTAKLKNALSQLSMFGVVFLFLLPSPLSADVGSWSMGAGLQLAKESVSTNSGSTSDLQMFQLSGQTSYIEGWDNLGGVVLTAELTQALCSNWPDSHYSVLGAATASLDLGWDFFVPLAKQVIWHYGPRFSAILVSGELSDTIGLQTGVAGVTFGLGAATEIDWHPFDTGWAYEDAFFVYGSAKVLWDFSSSLTGRAQMGTGFGFSTE